MREISDMDSICDEPRSAPVPFCSSKKDYPAFHVPSPSIISHENTTKIIPENTKRSAFNQNFWFQDRNDAYHSQVGLNQKFPTESSFRKQVRFENKTSFPQDNLGKNTSYDGFKPSDFSVNTEEETPCLPKKSISNLVQSKPFEEIYMANIPNRHLDLSIINEPYQSHNQVNVRNSNSSLENLVKKDFSKPEVKFNKQKISDTRVLKDFNDVKSKKDLYLKDKCWQSELPRSDVKNKDGFVVDLYNYNFEKFKEKDIQLKCDYQELIKGKTRPQNNFKIEEVRSNSKVDQAIQTQEMAVCLPENKPSDEPTVKDLVEIVKQQNEQLLLLQKQVAMLLENQGKIEQIEAPKTFPQNNKPPKNLLNTLNQGKNIAQYSIDVMTSFEVSIRPQNNNGKNFKENQNYEPKIQEITENRNNNLLGKDSKNSEFSLALNEPVNVVEINQSPDNSIHVDMQDYSSDSECDEENNGWTFYNKIMGQVNHVLNKTSETGNQKRDKSKLNPLEAAKKATIKHLKKLGVNVPEDTNSSEGSSSKTSCSPTEISYAVKQLLMKYMPDEQLVKASQNAEEWKFNEEKMIKRRPEFSFATIQYMQKYNLFEPGMNGTKNPTTFNKANKILDITALKQQPKLM